MSSEPYVAVAMRHFGAAVSMTARLVLWLSEPLIPVTDRVKEPVDEEDVELTVTVEVASVLDVGVTGLGKATETPDGADPTQE